MPQDVESHLGALCAEVIAAKAAGQSVFICGGKTRQFYGEPLPQDVPAWLDMSVLKGITSYAPTEMVLTAWAGTPLADVEAALAANNQMLAFEPPRFGAAGTLGGCVATGLSGPARMACGPLSDFVLGCRLLTANGEVLRFGGEVMKNVAGYDVSRLLAGSLGILGALAEVSLKVVPKPACEASCVVNIDEAEALALCLGWRRQLLPITATAWLPDAAAGGQLYVRLAGNEAAVRQGLGAIDGRELDSAEAGSFWLSIRDQTHAFFASQPLWRVALPPKCAPLLNGDTQLHEWSGTLRWLTDVDDAATLRAEVEALGGSALLYRRGNLATDIASMHPLKPVVQTLHHRLKQEFDPEGVFNPNRLVRGL